MSISRGRCCYLALCSGPVLHFELILRFERVWHSDQVLGFALALHSVPALYSDLALCSELPLKAELAVECDLKYESLLHCHLVHGLRQGPFEQVQSAAEEVQVDQVPDHRQVLKDLASCRVQGESRYSRNDD